MQSLLKSITFFLFFSVVAVFAFSGCDSKTEPPPKPKAVGQKINKGPKGTAVAGGKIDRPEAPAGGKIDRPESPAGGKIDRPEAPAGGKIDRPEAPAGGKIDRPEAPAGGKIDRPELPPGGRNESSAASPGGRIDRQESSAGGRIEKTLEALPRKPTMSSSTAEMEDGPDEDSADGKGEILVGEHIAIASDSLGQPVALPVIDTGPPPYDPTGKIDPFMPLFKDEPEIKEPPPDQPTKKTPPKRIPRTPLERIAIGQLQLTGVIQTESGNKGVVQESTGKGYIVSKGTYIGTNGGRVTEIFKDKIVVEEEVQDILGKLTTQKRELKLQKPFGED